MGFLDKAKEQEILPAIALREGVVFPFTENVLIFGRQKSLKALEYLEKEKSDRLVLLMQKDHRIDDPKISDLYTVGIVAQISKKVKGERGETNVLVRGEKRVRVKEFISVDPFFIVKVEYLEDKVEDDKETEALVKLISNNLKKAINLGKSVDFNFLVNILNITSPLSFSYNVAMILDIKPQERQQLLEIDSLKERLKKEIEFLNREIEILELEHKLAERTRKKFEKGIKESFLREKKRIIEEELGEDTGSREIEEYKKKIKAAKMPKEVEKKALKELDRLRRMSPFNPEASYIRNYLDWLIELPWVKVSPSEVDIKKAKKILDEDHYGLKKIKERILEYIAVMKLKAEKKKNEGKKKSEGENKTRRDYQPTILCFVGPPGVGKTSLGRSIARALGRKFVKVSLGGIRDEADIRGHRRTYVGALPGRIIQGIKEAGTRNPVFMLDEIDKIGKDYRGDPSAALLEALDPEQNHSFVDHYLDVPFDLSDVLFITTANILDTIPPALLDRLEVIHFPGYTEDEKFKIAKQHLIPKQLKAHALEDRNIKLTDKAVSLIIRRYTREAGVRELERQIAAIMRKIARQIVEKKVDKVNVSARDLNKYLGPYKYSDQVIEDKNYVGISTGLAWTQFGGDILFIEVAVMPGKGNLTLTGQLGEVMKESCQAALSYIRSRWKEFGLEKDFFSNIDIHVHVPEGAVPKDGPSAGIAITTAMLSALIKIPVRRDVAMTGEITLRGRVLEIGGVKEKVIAAHRSGIKKVIMPKDNKKDLEDIPKYVLKDIKFVFVDHLDRVWKETLAVDKLKKSSKKSFPPFLS